MALPVDRDVELQEVAQGAVRPAADTDAVDGVRPQWVAEPPTPEIVAAVLAWCTRHRRAVVIRGGGTRMSWGRPPASVDLVLSTQQLTRITHYEPGDLTVTVESGMPIARLNRELARHGQWLPLDAGTDSATVGGALATNDSGPLRHRYGAPRDQLIGIHLATADGRLAAAGGRVVKNVAGYDLGRLVAGSFGAFAAIVSATFKLAPVPAASSTFVFTFRHGASMAQAAAAVSASQLDPISVEAEAVFDRGGSALFELLVRFGGPGVVNQDEMTRAEAIVEPFGPSERARVDDDATIWRDRARQQGGAAGARVRASWMPADLPALLDVLAAVGRDLPVRLAFHGRATTGSGTVLLDGDAAAQVATVERLRACPETFGHVVLARASRDVRDRVDVWGPPSSAAAVIRSIKHALDPAGILNAQRGPI